MRIAIVDDRMAEAAFMKKLLCSFADETNLSFDIACFTSGGEFLAAFEQNRFDVVFMDIYMDGMTGVEAARILKKRDNRCVLIFLTTSPEHMREAFVCHAFEYIEKPVDYERVRAVMTDVMNILPDNSRYMEFVCNRQSVRLMYSDFAAEVSADHYIEITDISGCVYKTRMRFSDFAAPLAGDERFLQINKGILVNMDLIDAFENNICIMQNGLKLPVKVRNHIQIEQRWLNYSFDKIRADQKKGGI